MFGTDWTNLVEGISTAKMKGLADLGGSSFSSLNKLDPSLSSSEPASLLICNILY